jgi:hypothetical protein
MPGVYRSSINLIRWRGAVPNALNNGRVEAFIAPGSVTEANVAKETTSQLIIQKSDAVYGVVTSSGVAVAPAYRQNLDVLSVRGMALELPQGGRLQVDVVHNFDKDGMDLSYWQGKSVSNAVSGTGLIPAYTPAFQANTVTVSSFLDAMSDAERLALEELAEQHSVGGRWARILLRRLTVNTLVDIAPVRAIVEKLKPALIQAGVWTAGSSTGRMRVWFTPPKTVPDPPDPPPTKARS